MSEVAAEWQVAAVADFCRDLGFDGAADGGTVNLAIGGHYLLDIEHAATGLVMALFREVSALEVTAKAQALLEGCHYDQYHPYLVQVGMRGDDALVLAVTLDQGMAGELLGAYDLMRRLYRDAGL